ncbi:hypothetical protein SAMN05720766_12019 [Fibrobacter sp. UWH9]|uniref:hypothetical protein n=1 Tax=Fibrobacter sp. UWH9 TaxID=1896213 RepID=UPI0009155B74|nr:hypothetical protein [Fibrobacter sp. UWH9]SHH70889.1 hypothetical protein SAMN05720766_12019 [Fibrobacter sp. UWH9]
MEEDELPADYTEEMLVQPWTGTSDDDMDKIGSRSRRDIKYAMATIVADLFFLKDVLEHGHNVVLGTESRFVLVRLKQPTDLQRIDDFTVVVGNRYVIREMDREILSASEYSHAAIALYNDCNASGVKATTTYSDGRTAYKYTIHGCPQQKSEWVDFSSLEGFRQYCLPGFIGTVYHEVDPHILKSCVEEEFPHTVSGLLRIVGCKNYAGPNFSINLQLRNYQYAEKVIERWAYSMCGLFLLNVTLGCGYSSFSARAQLLRYSLITFGMHFPVAIEITKKYMDNQKQDGKPAYRKPMDLQKFIQFHGKHYKPFKQRKGIVKQGALSSFKSNKTLAQEIGCSSKTIQRARKRDGVARKSVIDGVLDALDENRVYEYDGKLDNATKVAIGRYNRKYTEQRITIKKRTS